MHRHVEEVGRLELAVHHHHRRRLVADARAHAHRDRALLGPGCTALPDREHEAVEHARVRVHRVEVGDEAHGRLRSPERDQAPSVEAAQRVDRAVVLAAQRATGLREDVERPLVTGVVQRPVARRVAFDQRDGRGHRPARHPARVPVQPDLLRADADPGVPRESFGRGTAELGAARHVLPLHEHGAVELRIVAGAHDEQSGPVRGPRPRPPPPSGRRAAGARRPAPRSRMRHPRAAPPRPRSRPAAARARAHRPAHHRPPAPPRPSAPAWTPRPPSGESRRVRRARAGTPPSARRRRSGPRPSTGAPRRGRGVPTAAWSSRGRGCRRHRPRTPRPAA